MDLIALSFGARPAISFNSRNCSRANLRPLVIAKIEDEQAVTNLDEIIRESDGVMVARGDLGIEIPYEELPIVQRRIVKTCLRTGNLLMSPLTC